MKKELLDDLHKYKKPLHDKLDNRETEINDSEFVKEYAKENKMTKTVFTLGYTPYDSFLDVIKEIDITKINRFLVGGCSQGWLCFFWNSIYPEIPAIGCDLIQPRIDYGKRLIEKHNIENVDIYVGDYRDFELNKGDVLWLNNCVFPKAVKEVNDILSKRPDIQLVSFRNWFPKKESLKHKKRLAIKTSWSENQQIYIY